MKRVGGVSWASSTLTRMTQAQPSGQDILAAARRLQEDKLAAVEAVAGTRARIAEIRAKFEAQLVEVEREDAVAYQAALKAGWAEDELRKVGIAAPARQAPGRPRKGRRTVGEQRELAAHAGLLGAQLRREAEASVRLDRDETHVVGEPVNTHGAPKDSPMEAVEHLRAAGRTVSA